MSSAEENTATQARQAEETETPPVDSNLQETVVEAVTPYWRRPHGRVRGVLTGRRP